MHKLFLFLALPCSVSFAQAASPAMGHPLIGSWSWTLPNRPQCTETWQYRQDGTWHGSSGSQTSEGSYALSARPGPTGFYQLSEVIGSSSAATDCSGDLPGDDGQPLARFIQFSPDSRQLIVCREESLNACFGPLRRQPG